MTRGWAATLAHGDSQLEELGHLFAHWSDMASWPWDGLLWSVGVRLLTVLLWAAPGLLCGAAIAFLLLASPRDSLVRRAATTRRLGPVTIVSIITGVLLLDALGALIVGWALLKLRYRPGVVAAFVLTGGVVTPWTLASLSLAGGLAAPVLVFALTMATGLAIAYAVEATPGFSRRSDAAPTPEGEGATKPDASVAESGDAPAAPAAPVAARGRELPLWTVAVAIGVALLGVVVMTVLGPEGHEAGHFLAERGPLTGLVATAITVPNVVNPERASAIAGLMFRERASFAGGIALLLGGAGVTLGGLWFLGRAMGWRRTGVALGCVVAVTVVFGGTTDAVAPRVASTMFEDFHGTDWVGFPHQIAAGSSLLRAEEWERVQDAALPQNVAGLIAFALAAVAALGVSLRRRGRDESKAETPSQTSPVPALPAVRWWGYTTALLVVLLAGTLLMGVPRPVDLADEMQTIVAEASLAAERGDLTSTETRLRQIRRLKGRIDLASAIWARSSAEGADASRERFLQSLQSLEQATSTAAPDTPLKDEAHRLYIDFEAFRQSHHARPS